MTTGVNAVNTSFVYGDNVATTGTTSDTVLVQNNDNTLIQHGKLAL